jgi:gamma-glutamyltranspeptidase
MAEPNTDTKRRKTLKIADKNAIQDLLRAGELTHSAIAERFEISERTVRRLANPHSAGARKSTSSTVPISIRPTPEELNGMDETWQAHGFRSRSHFLRHLVRVSSEAFDVEPNVADGLAEIARQLRGVGANINQMAKLANKGRLNWSEGEKREIEDLNRGIGELRREISRFRGNAIYRGRLGKLTSTSHG